MNEFDRFGHCIICHKNMTIEEVIDGRVQVRFTPDYDEKEVLLSDNSKMRIVTCKECKEKITEKEL